MSRRKGREGEREDRGRRRGRSERVRGVEHGPGELPPGATHFMMPRQLFEGVSDDQMREFMRKFFPDARELSPDEFKELSKELPTVEISEDGGTHLPEDN